MLPDVPAIGEVVPGYDASGWFGICAPKGTPDEIIARLNTEIRPASPIPTRASASSRWAPSRTR